MNRPFGVPALAGPDRLKAGHQTSCAPQPGSWSQCMRKSERGLSTNAVTVAYWRFETGPAGANDLHPGADGAFNATITDVSGNGNNLSAWTQGGYAGFAYRTDAPFAFIPQNGETNSIIPAFPPPRAPIAAGLISEASAIIAPHSMKLPTHWVWEQPRTLATSSAMVFGREPTAYNRFIRSTGPALLLIRMEPTFGHTD